MYGGAFHLRDVHVLAGCRGDSVVPTRPRPPPRAVVGVYGRVAGLRRVGALLGAAVALARLLGVPAGSETEQFYGAVGAGVAQHIERVGALLPLLHARLPVKGVPSISVVVPVSGEKIALARVRAEGESASGAIAIRVIPAFPVLRYGSGS